MTHNIQSIEKSLNFDVAKLVRQVSQAKEEVKNICKPILDFFNIR